MAKNELAKVPVPDRPNQIWAADITYIETQDGWLYLAGILDLYSYKVAVWNTSDSLAAEFVTNAWKKAWKKHRLVVCVKFSKMEALGRSLGFCLLLLLGRFFV